jgi:hypothetical protein
MTRYLLLFDSYGLDLWGALSNERMVLSFLYAAGPRQRILSRVGVPWVSLPYFTLSDLRLLFSSPLGADRIENMLPTIHLLRLSYSLPLKHVYRVIAYQCMSFLRLHFGFHACHNTRTYLKMDFFKCAIFICIDKILNYFSLN